MKLIGKPFGYVLWGTFVGLCLGVALLKLSHDAGLEMLVLTIGGAFLGYWVEQFALRRRQQPSTQLPPTTKGGNDEGRFVDDGTAVD
jgi:hypothetical protein